MKKITISRRLENAFNVFSADEISGENTLEIYRNESNVRHERKVENAGRKNGTLEIILKQTLLFFPGTFILYYLGMGFLPLIAEFFETRAGSHSSFRFYSFACLLAASVLMTWLGLGNIRKAKHFVIPASIFGVGVLWIALVGISYLVLNYFGIQMFFRDGFLIYFFPLALVVPFLAKGLVDRDS